MDCLVLSSADTGVILRIVEFLLLKPTENSTNSLLNSPVKKVVWHETKKVQINQYNIEG